MEKQEEKQEIPSVAIPDIGTLYKMGLARTGMDLGRPPSDAEAYDAMVTLAIVLRHAADANGPVHFNPADGTYEPIQMRAAADLVDASLPENRPTDKSLETSEDRDARRARLHAPRAIA